jgi:hypothetical protein
MDHRNGYIQMSQDMLANGGHDGLLFDNSCLAPGTLAEANSALRKGCRESSLACNISVGARIARILSSGIAALLSKEVPAERSETGFIKSITRPDSSS